VVGRQNADIADTLYLRDVAVATIFLAFYIWRAHWRHLANTTNRPCAAAMRPYVKLLLPLVYLPVIYLLDSVSSVSRLFLSKDCCYNPLVNAQTTVLFINGYIDVMISIRPTNKRFIRHLRVGCIYVLQPN